MKERYLIDIGSTWPNIDRAVFVALNGNFKINLINPYPQDDPLYKVLGEDIQMIKTYYNFYYLEGREIGVNIDIGLFSDRGEIRVEVVRPDFERISFTPEFWLSFANRESCKGLIKAYYEKIGISVHNLGVIWRIARVIYVGDKIDCFFSKNREIKERANDMMDRLSDYQVNTESLAEALQYCLPMHEEESVENFDVK